MAIIKSENWDGVTAPSIPSGWHNQAAGGFNAIVTSSSVLTISSPNGVYLAGQGASAPRSLLWGTQDGASGNVQVQGTGLFETNSSNSSFSVFARCNTSTFNYGSSTFYESCLSGSAGEFQINSILTGTLTTLFSIAVPSIAANIYHKITFKLVGSSLQAQCQRLSDGYYLNMATGAWVSGATSVSLTDSSISGQGYAGWIANPVGLVGVVGDDWSLSTASNFLAGSGASDTFAGSGAFTDTASMAKTEGHDTFSASGSFSDLGSITGVEHGDTFAGSSGFFSAGSMATTERGDALASWATVSPRLQALERGDAFSASGTATGPVGTMAYTEHGDTLSSTGGFTFDTHASLWGAGANDAMTATATESSQGAVAAVEHGDVLVGSGSTEFTGAIAAAGTGDTFRGGFERVGYHIYSNTGTGDPIDYDSPLASTEQLTYTTGSLSYPGTWQFGVRAYWVVSGLEEQNVDAVATIILDASGVDITNRPPAPIGVRGFATAGGSIRVEWSTPPVQGPKAPTGFHIYKGTSGVPDYTTVAATVSAASVFANTFFAVLSSLTDGTAYTIGVRSYNATAEEANTNTITVTADATGPDAVLDLTATATS